MFIYFIIISVFIYWLLYTSVCMETKTILRRESMKKQMKNLFTLCLALVMVILAAPATDAGAASAKAKAYSAYKKVLKDGFEMSTGGEGTTHETAKYFTLIDITGDGLEELVVDTVKGTKKTSYVIFTYDSKNGIQNIFEDYVIETYYVNAKKNSVCTHYSWKKDNYYSVYAYNKKKGYFESNSKTLKKLPKGYTALKTEYKNTSANRNKILK